MPNHDDFEGDLIVDSENIVFQNRLWNTVQDLVNQYEITISSDCEFLMRSLIQEGISHMDMENRLSDGPSRELAEANLTVFVSRMVITVLMQGSQELDIDTFHVVESTFAVWPFYGG